MRKTNLLCILLAFTVAANASEPQPRWEVGAALSGITLPDYRGSKETSFVALPYPFGIYRSDLLKADDDGVRGILFNNPNVQLNFSSSASLATDGEDNTLRDGMHVIDPTFEIGPALDINLTGETTREGWKLQLPVRAVFAFGDDGLDHVGELLNPRFLYESGRLDGGWRFHARLGVLYADEQYHDYYYSVAPQHVRPGRPAYDAEAGNSGISTGFGVSRRHGRLLYGVFFRYDDISDAVFVDSPLVETEDYFSASVGIAWIFAESPDKY